MSNLDVPIRSLKQTVKVVESYIGSSKREIKEIEKKIKEKKRILKSEKARLKRLETRKPMYEEGVKVLEKKLGRIK